MHTRFEIKLKLTAQYLFNIQKILHHMTKQLLREEEVHKTENLILWSMYLFILENLKISEMLNFVLISS